MTSTAASLLRVVDAGAAVAAPKKTAVILINIGTPDAPDTASVRRYLNQFLGDPRVLDIGALQRFLLLKLVILPFRSPKSAAQYKSIWTERGSPLMFHTEDVATKLRALLGASADVSIGMRYGNPSLSSALSSAAQSGASRVVLVPMFPQYASASTGSALELAYDIFGRMARVPDVSVVPPFFDDAGFLDSVAGTIRDVIAPRGGNSVVDHVLFSYHGLPLHQVQAVHKTCEGTDACCAELTVANASCYRAQCLWTTRELVKRAGVGAHSTSFQSRLGKAVWLLPNTEHVVADLAKSGVKKLAVACPSFVADCLETVEEIGVRARETFAQAGGSELHFIPCVNARDDFVQAVAAMVQRATGEVST
jgi:ferrochelatase